MVESVRRVRKTDLARNTRQVINGVLRGQTAVIESHGRPEVAILDIVDYRIIRAVMRYYAQVPEIDLEAGLPDQELAALPDPQGRFNLVLAYYLAGAVSLVLFPDPLGIGELFGSNASFFDKQRYDRIGLFRRDCLRGAILPGNGVRYCLRSGH